MVDLVAIPADTIDANWHWLAGQLDEIAAVSGGRLTKMDVARSLLERDTQLWAAKDGDKVSVMTTQLLNFPQMRECRVIGARGQDVDRWLALWPQFEAWAIRNGCAVMTAECRPGWKRLLAPLGFTETRLVLEKRL